MRPTALQLQPLVLKAECVELYKIWEGHMVSRRRLIDLFQILYTLLHFETKATRSDCCRKSMPNFTLFYPYKMRGEMGEMFESVFRTILDPPSNILLPLCRLENQNSGKTISKGQWQNISSGVLTRKKFDQQRESQGVSQSDSLSARSFGDLVQRRHCLERWRHSRVCQMDGQADGQTFSQKTPHLWLRCTTS